jgi:DHA2 family multidrug resistance protein
MMPLAALLLRRFDARLLLVAGLLFFGASCFVNATLTNLTAHDQLKVAQLLRAAGMPLTIVPLTALATGGLDGAESGSASALFNMLRNLGGSIGIALLSTQLDWRKNFHSVRIGESVSLFATATQERLAALAGHFAGLGADPVQAKDQALAALEVIVRREAFVMSFADCFFILGAVMSAMVAAAVMCRPAAAGAGPGAH